MPGITRKIDLPVPETAADTTLEWLMVSDLNFDDSYQRPVHPNRVARIVKRFDPDGLGVILVSKRPDGRYFVYDGRTRIAALREMGYLDQRVPCEVKVGLTPQREAALFTTFNEDRVKPSSIERFNARITAGDPIALGLDALLQRYGYKVNTNSPIKAIAALETVYVMGGAAVADALLSVSREAWGDEQVPAAVLTGLGLFITRYDQQITDRARLVRVLAQHRPLLLLADAKVLSASMARGSSNTANAACIAILRTYNKGLRHENRLAEYPVNGRNFWDRAPVIAPEVQN